MPDAATTEAAARVARWFEAGTLVRPCADAFNFVDLVRAFRLLGSMTDPGTDSGTERSRHIANLIGRSRSYLFVLVDGLGFELVDSLPSESFLRSNLVERLQAIFPATTASALTTLATGLWPCRHCVPGWWTRLPDAGLTAVTLPFTERTTSKPLGEFGIAPQTLLPAPSIWPGLAFAVHAVMPDEIANSVFARYVTGGSARIGYRDLDDAMLTAHRIVAEAVKPTFVYVYIPYLDTLLHATGSGDERVRHLLLELDRQLHDLSLALPPSARLVVSADHGLVDVRDDRVVILSADDPLTSHLLCQPSGEPSVPVFHIQEGAENDFAFEFNRRFADLFALLSVDEAQSLRLYGPSDLAPAMKKRLGTFIGIAPEPAKLYFEPCGSSTKHKGIHGGLRKAEMLIPLIVV